MGDLTENFSRWEVACGDGCGFDSVDHETLMVLVALRDHFGRRVDINSGCRCEAHNKRERGSRGSMHLDGRATDIVVDGVHADRVADYLESKYPGKYGIGRYRGHTHIDTKTGVKRRWDKR